MKNFKVLLVVVIFCMTFNLVGCATKNLTAENHSVAKTMAVTAESSAVEESKVKIKVGELVTIPISVLTDNPFSSFQLCVGYGDSKVNIIASKLVSSNATDMYDFSPDYDPALRGDPSDLKACWEENIKRGLNKTAIITGVTLGQFHGETPLFTITIKGISTGETMFNLKSASDGFTDENGVGIELPTLQNFTVVVD